MHNFQLFARCDKEHLANVNLHQIMKDPHAESVVSDRVTSLTLILTRDTVERLSRRPIILSTEGQDGKQMPFHKPYVQ